jgi:hypothetical protein
MKERNVSAEQLPTTNQMVRINNDTYIVTLVDATDGLDMVSKLKPLQICRYFDKYVYRTADGKAMACYVNDIFNNWSI